MVDVRSTSLTVVPSPRTSEELQQLKPNLRAEFFPVCKLGLPQLFIFLAVWGPDSLAFTVQLGWANKHPSGLLEDVTSLNYDPPLKQ